MLGHREDFEALVATACYESLTDGEQARLDAYCAKHPDWQAEATEIMAFAQDIPVPEVVFQGNLLPVVRGELESASRWVGWFRKAWVPVAATAFVGIVALYGYYNVPEPGNVTPDGGSFAAEGPVTEVFAAVDDAVARRAYGDALQLLEATVAAHRDEPLAGMAQARLAEMYFSQLQRYDDAFAAYEQLRRDYPAVWNQDPEAIRRFNLLTETKSKGYEALYALDAAVESASPFAQYERVIAQNPNTLIAMEAINRMREEVGGLEVRDGAIEVAALELVRRQCTNPVAIAQVNLTLGDSYLRHLNDREQARKLFTETAANGNGALAAAAHEALARLEAAP